LREAAPLWGEEAVVAALTVEEPALAAPMPVAEEEEVVLIMEEEVARDGVVVVGRAVRDALVEESAEMAVSAGLPAEEPAAGEDPLPLLEPHVEEVPA